MTDHDCPTEEELYAVLAGEAGVSTKSHVETCEACRAQLRKLQSESTILQHVGKNSRGQTETLAPSPYPGVIGKFIIVGIWDDNPSFVTYRGLHAIVRREVFVQVAKKPILDLRLDQQSFLSACGRWMQPRQNVAQLLDAGEFESRPYLVVESNNGVRLDRLIPQDLIDAPTLMQIFGIIAKTLVDRNIPHPLLQTASIVVDEVNQPTLVDWAAAAEFDLPHDDNSVAAKDLTAHRFAIAFCNAVLPEVAITKTVPASTTTGTLTASLVARKIPTAVAELMMKAIAADSNSKPSLMELAAVLVPPIRKQFWKNLLR